MYPPDDAGVLGVGAGVETSATLGDGDTVADVLTTGALLGCWTYDEEEEEEETLVVVGLWKNSPAEAEELKDRLEDEELSTGLCTAAGEDVDAAIDVGVRAIGVTKVVGNAKLTLAPLREVTGTGAGIEGAVEVFMAESSHSLIHP